MKRRETRLPGRLFRSALAVLLVLLMILPAVGCAAGKKAQLPETTAIETPIEEQTEAQTENFTAPEFLYSENREFYAYKYLQCDYLNDSYSLIVRIEDSQVYLNGELFDKISYTENYNFFFGNQLTSRWGQPQEIDPETEALLDKIKNHKGFYLVEKSKADHHYGDPVILCFIDDQCYILSIRCGQVDRLHIGKPEKISQQEALVTLAPMKLSSLPSINDLSDDVIADAERAWLTNHRFPLFSDPENRVGGPAYYGCYGENCVVFFEPGELCVVTHKIIGSFDFMYSSSFCIWVCKGGEIMQLEEAYERNLLNWFDLHRIYSVHHHIALHEPLLPKDEHGCFADDRVQVVLTHEESMKFKTYTPEDFSEISCVNVYFINAGVAEKVKNGELPGEDFKVTLVLELSEHGEEAILNAIELLNARDDVYSAQPEYFTFCIC